MTDREAFERWAEVNHYDLHHYCQIYTNLHTQAAWSCWQAALAYRSEQASQGQWIPVGERLPDAFPVWGTDGEKQFRVDSVKDFGARGGLCARMHMGGTTFLISMTHWMPLPAAPLPHKEGE